MRWLVTGGAGYIGSHVIHALLAAGADPCVIDDLSCGVRSRVPSQVPFMHADIRDAGALVDAMDGCDGVIHLAGRKSVDESVDRPLAYWDANLNGTLDVLRAMSYRRVPRIVFSSTASVYAEYDRRVSEDDRLAPASPYGASKAAAEQAIRDYARASGTRYAILRYFNVAGCGTPALRDTSKDNLIPSVLSALLSDESPTIYGDDYATPDGTAVRDYVHVQDVADAHTVIARSLDRIPSGVYNIGTGQGTSVREVVEGLIRVSGVGMFPFTTGRRNGDVGHAVADVSRVYWNTGWKAQRNITDILVSAWDSVHSRH
jgi:UDP-glucose 4-epimerase